MKVCVVIFATSLTLACMFSPNAARAQVEFQSGRFLTSDGVELHYLEAGSGPTPVFVPGWTMPAEIWEPQLDHVQQQHQKRFE